MTVLGVLTSAVLAYLGMIIWIAWTDDSDPGASGGPRP